MEIAWGRRRNRECNETREAKKVDEIGERLFRWLETRKKFQSMTKGGREMMRAAHEAILRRYYRKLEDPTFHPTEDHKRRMRRQEYELKILYELEEEEKILQNMEEHERPKELGMTFNQNLLKSENVVREKAEASQDAQEIESQDRQLLEEDMEKGEELGRVKDSAEQMEATEESLKKAFEEARREITGPDSENQEVSRESLKKAFEETRQECTGPDSESQEVSRESLEKAFEKANQESAEPRAETIRKSEEFREFEESFENKQNFEAGEDVIDFNREDNEKLEQKRSKIREALETIKKPYLELSEEERLLKENIGKTLNDYSEMKNHANLTEEQREFMRLLEEENQKFLKYVDSKGEIKESTHEDELFIKESKVEKEIEDLITEVINDTDEVKEETQKLNGKGWDDEADMALQEIFMDEQEMNEPQLELKPLETKELQPTESDVSKKQQLIDPQFLELTEDYRQQTGAKKINYGLEIQQKFRNWIRNNPTLEPSEKQRLLEYCDDYEALIKKAIMGQVLFSDKSVMNIIKYLNKEFEISPSFGSVKALAIEKLGKIEYLKRFNPTLRKILPEQIPEIVHKYKQGASENQLAKEYNVSQTLIHDYLKKQGVEPHGFGDWKKIEIISPQEFTPDLAKFIALIMTEGYLDERRVVITNSSYALIEEFKNLVRQNFQIDNFIEYFPKENNPNWKKRYICEIKSVELAKFLSNYVDKSDYQKATLPKEIFDLSEKNVGEVLRIAFSGDGSVSLRPFKSSERERWYISNQVEFTCASPSLKKQWRMLIESLGIKCRVDKNHIIISQKDNIIKFNEKIGFIEGISIRKNTLWEDYTRQEVLNALIESYKYPRLGFDSKEQALMFLNSLFKKTRKRR